jgi:NADPH:quinone reductase-like Zn-dependent oxidoreductase
MQVIVVTAFGGPEVLTEAESPDPKPGPGQITIDTSHAAVGFVDVLLRRGDVRDNPACRSPRTSRAGRLPAPCARSARASRVSVSASLS